MPPYVTWSPGSANQSPLLPPGPWSPVASGPYGNPGSFTPGSSYPSNPPPQGTSYSSTFGGVPGSLSIPNPFQDLSSVYPNLSGTNAQLSQDILSELSGQLSPETQALLQDRGAAFGVSSGMPGSGLARNRTLRDLGLTSEAVQQQGISDYAKAIQAVSGTQTVPPIVQAEIAARNAQMQAAPIPAAAQSYARQLFDNYLNQLRGPGGGTGAIGSPAAGSSALGFGFGTLGPYGTQGDQGMSDTEFQGWQDYVMGYGSPGSGAEPGTYSTDQYAGDSGDFDMASLYPSPFDEEGGF